MNTQFAFEKLCSKEPNKAEIFLAAKNSLENLIKNDVDSVLDIWEFVRDTSYINTEVHTNPEFLLMDGFKEGENFDVDKKFHIVDDEGFLQSFNEIDNSLSPIDWVVVLSYLADNP